MLTETIDVVGHGFFDDSFSITEGFYNFFSSYFFFFVSQFIHLKLITYWVSPCTYVNYKYVWKWQPVYKRLIKHYTLIYIFLSRDLACILLFVILLMLPMSTLILKKILSIF